LAEVGFYDYRHRFYSPTIGRFMQTDPTRFGAGDVNLYRYVFNEPVDGSDELGLGANDVSSVSHGLPGLPCGPTTSSPGTPEVDYPQGYSILGISPKLYGYPGEGSSAPLLGPAGRIRAGYVTKPMKPTTRNGAPCYIPNVCSTTCCSAGQKWTKTWQSGYINGAVESIPTLPFDPLNPTYTGARCIPLDGEEDAARARCKAEAPAQCSGN